MSDDRYVFHCYMAADISRLKKLLAGDHCLDLKLSADEKINAQDLNGIFAEIIDIYDSCAEGSEEKLLSGKILSEFDKIYGGNRERIVKLIPKIKSALEKCAGDSDADKAEGDCPAYGKVFNCGSQEDVLGRVLGFENAMIFLKNNGWKSDDCSEGCIEGILPRDIVDDCIYLYDMLGHIRNNSALNIEDKDSIDLFNNFIFCMLPTD
ncbi:MAG: hypothetical protein K6C99_01970 [Lachnospiraceae bacterium]|nr:hypothetical protein [Lachnospiraceae bacterium]